jgi:hypothetical protein
MVPGIPSDGLPQPATPKCSARSRHSQQGTRSCDFRAPGQLPIQDSAPRIPVLTREQAQIRVKFLFGRGGPPLEGLMANWRIEDLPSRALCGATRPVTPSPEFRPTQSDSTVVRGQRHGD